MLLRLQLGNSLCGQSAGDFNGMVLIVKPSKESVHHLEDFVLQSAKQLKRNLESEQIESLMMPGGKTAAT